MGRACRMTAGAATPVDAAERADHFLVPETAYIKAEPDWRAASRLRLNLLAHRAYALTTGKVARSGDSADLAGPQNAFPATRCAQPQAMMGSNPFWPLGCQ